MNTLNSSYSPASIHIANSATIPTDEEAQVRPTPRTRSKRGIGATHRRWPQNSTVTIGFQEVKKEQEDLIKAAFSKISPHVNLKFKFVAGPDADIRVGPNTVKGQNGSSWVGIQAKTAPATEPTLSIDFNRPAEKVIATALHEGMHAIGVLHEHQHPDRTIEFDEKELDKTFKDAADPKELAKETVLDTIKRQKNGPTFTPYDQKSIMHYEFTSKELNGGAAVLKSNELSEGDIALLRLMYPPRPLPSIDDSIKKLQATVATTKLWPDLSTVTVSLLGMNDEQKKLVKHNIEKLQPYVNTSIKFTDNADGDIRISLTDGGKSWSDIGTDAENKAPSDPTVGIHWDANKKKTARDIKHMFAKALGFTSITLPKKSG